MRSRPSQSSRHIFISPSGDVLPRWLQAFPAATVISFGEAEKLPLTDSLVWLRLDPMVPVQEQLALLGHLTGDARVVVLANTPSNEEALTLFAAGIRGYCNAHATAANLRQVARVVQNGGLWIGEALMRRLLASTQAAISREPVGAAAADSTAGDSANPLSALTKREQEVARAVANGSSNKEIARLLGITERTIKAHASSIFEKLKVRDRLHLALIVKGHRPI